MIDPIEARKRLQTRKEEILSGKKAQLSKECTSNQDEQAVETVPTHIKLSMTYQETKELNDIQRAFLRLEDGTYGICKECQEAISDKRLRVNASADTCVPCKEKTEVPVAQPRRPSSLGYSNPGHIH